MTWLRWMACTTVAASLPAAAAAADKPAAGKQVPAAVTVRVEEDGAVREVELRYLVFLPEGYGELEQRWPLLLFLHGAGERGDDLERVKVHGPPKLVEADPEFPFVVISPQCPAGERWDPNQLRQLVDHAEKTYILRKDQLYVTGLSMGGFGTWDLVAHQPGRFAAAVPICGGGDPARAEEIKQTPLWVFHGAKDGAVKLEQSERMVEAVKAAGGDVEFTVYPEAGHDSWTETYANPKLYAWLLEHHRQAPQ